MTSISKRRRARFYINKNRKNRKVYIYIYKKPDTLQKARQFALRLYSQKAGNFKLRDF